MNIKKIKPMFTKIVTTARVYAVDTKKGNVIVDTKSIAGNTMEYQTVVAVGSSVRDVKVGDLVCINPDRYAVKKYKEDSVKADLMTQQIVGYNIPQIKLDGVKHLILDTSDIEYVIEEFEEEKDSGLININPIIEN